MSLIMEWRVSSSPSSRMLTAPCWAPTYSLTRLWPQNSAATSSPTKSFMWAQRKWLWWATPLQRPPSSPCQVRFSFIICLMKQFGSQWDIVACSCQVHHVCFFVVVWIFFCFWMQRFHLPLHMRKVFQNFNHNNPTFFPPAAMRSTSEVCQWSGGTSGSGW